MKKHDSVERTEHEPNAPRKLEPADFLVFENVWLKLELARERMTSAETSVEQVKHALARKYQVQGNWRIDPQLRALVHVGQSDQSAIQGAGGALGSEPDSAHSASAKEE